MKRIFLTLAILANIIMIIAMVLGLQVGDPMLANGRDPEVNHRIGTHILIGLGALTGTTMVHALIFTYFMGTSRWIEETSAAYSLSRDFHLRNQKIKYGILPGILISFLVQLPTRRPPWNLGASLASRTPRFILPQPYRHGSLRSSLISLNTSPLQETVPSSIRYSPKFDGSVLIVVCLSISARPSSLNCQGKRPGHADGDITGPVLDKKLLFLV